MKGQRLSSWEDRDTVCMEAPDPELRLSPLARPAGTASSFRAQDCRKCRERAECMESVLALGTFAVWECEKALRLKTLQGRANVLNEEVRAVLLQHPDGMTVTEIGAAVNRNHSTIQSALRCLERRQQVVIDRTNKNSYRYYAVPE